MCIRDRLNGYSYRVRSAPTATTFTIGDIDSGAPVDSSEFVAPYVRGGEARRKVNTIAGLGHLEGREVTVLADGNVITGLTVEDGHITLPERYGRVHAGLRYVAEVETLPLEAQDRTVQGARKSLTEATVRVHRSRGLLCASAQLQQFYDLPVTENFAWGLGTALYSGDVHVPMGSHWGTSGAIIIRQPDPLPMDVLAVVAEFDTEDRR